MALALLVGSFISSSPQLSADEEAVLAGLEVQVLSPQASDAAWIKTLLVKNGAAVTVGVPAPESGERVFGLVILAGSGRQFSRPRGLAETTPILGVGSSGHAYFGSLKLKHGSPFS